MAAAATAFALFALTACTSFAFLVVLCCTNFFSFLIETSIGISVSLLFSSPLTFHGVSFCAGEPSIDRTRRSSATACCLLATALALCWRLAIDAVFDACFTGEVCCDLVSLTFLGGSFTLGGYVYVVWLTVGFCSLATCCATMGNIKASSVSTACSALSALNPVLTRSRLSIWSKRSFKCFLCSIVT